MLAHPLQLRAGTETRDVHITFWRRPASDNAERFINHYIAEALDAEATNGFRKRARKTADHERFCSAARAVLADICYRVLTNPGKGIVVPRSHCHLGGRSRYTPDFVTQSLPIVFDRICSAQRHHFRQDIGLIEKGGSGVRTTLFPLNRFKALVIEAGLQVSDFTLSKSEEVLVLKSGRSRDPDGKQLSEYIDDALTNRIRADIVTLNDWLEAADIAVRCEAPVTIDPSDRRLRRYFSLGRFDANGRLYGGFWMPMAKMDRFACITIDGEPIAECDFRQMNPHIAYALARETPPPGDLYDIPGYEAHREGIKKLFNALFWVDQPLKSLPRSIREEGLFPMADRVDKILCAIELRHPALKDFFARQVGYQLMFHESQVLIESLQRMRAANIVALPIHDAVLVARSRAQEACSIMEDAFKARLGQTCPVRVEVE